MAEEKWRLAAEAFRQRMESEPLPQSVGHLLDEAAALYAARPLWVSIDGQGEELTYGGFHGHVLRCARGLRRRGVKAGSHVAVMLPNVPAILIAWMALARLGAVMVSVNPRITPRELAFALDRSDSRMVILDANCLDTLASTEGAERDLLEDNVIVHGETAAHGLVTWEELLGDDEALEVSPDCGDRDALLNIQFTSGTTGFPKGCMLTHRYWLTIGKVLAQRGPEVHRLLVDLPLFYLGAQWRFFMALYAGGTVYVAERYSLHAWADRVRRHGIHFATANDALAKLPESEFAEIDSLKRVSIAALAGPLHADLERRVGAPAREGYGMTEIGATLYTPFENSTMIGSGSCGIPAPFRECRIVDAEGREVAVDAAGELLVRGPGIFQGYYNDAEATETALRDGWFHTGDLFRKDAEGFHYWVGRTKDMIRRSGENIAAAEVESVLRTMSGIREAAVVPVPDSFRGEEIKAYVVLADDLTPAEADPVRIAEHCRERLPPFKVPRLVAYVASLPMTASGKVAKSELKGGDLEGEHTYDLATACWLPERGPRALESNE